MRCIVMTTVLTCSLGFAVVGCSKTTRPPAVPDAPTGVHATPGGTSVKLTWSPVERANYYVAYLGTSPGVNRSHYTTTLTGPTSPITFFGLTKGTAYYFVVTAVGHGGESGESAEVSATPVGGRTNAVTTESRPLGPGREVLVGTFSNPSGYATTIWFEYGTTSALGSATSTRTFSQELNYSVEDTLNGLAEGVVHHWRLHTENADGVFAGEIKSFRSLVTPQDLAQGFIEPYRLRVRGGIACWVDRDRAAVVPVSGGSVMTIGAPAMSEQGRSLALDATKAYWADIHTIWSAPLAGGSLETLATGRHAVWNLARHSTWLYWLEESGLMRMDAAGGMIDTLVRSGSLGPMVVDDAGIFWADAYSRTIDWQPLSGSATTTLVADVQPYDMVHGAGWLFWTAYDGIQRAPDTGGLATTIVTGRSDGEQLAVDGAYLYWTLAGLIMKRELSSGVTEPIVLDYDLDVPCYADEPAIDATSLYWISPGCHLGTSGTLRRVPK